MTLRTATIVAMIAFAGLGGIAMVAGHGPMIDQITAVQPASYASLHMPPGPDDGQTLLAHLMYGQVPVDGGTTPDRVA
jgi:hypothetical protein